MSLCYISFVDPRTDKVKDGKLSGPKLVANSASEVVMLQKQSISTLRIRLLASTLLLPLYAITADAQQITGVAGSPSATVTIDGKQLPPPAPNFGGVIEEKASESKPWWPPRVVPQKGAPNVLLIMTDDQGFGAPSTFGGVIPTPTMDRIASAGRRTKNDVASPRPWAARLAENQDGA